MWKYVWVKKCVKIREMLFKNWKWLFKITNQTPPIFLFFFFFMSWYEYPCYSKLKILSLSNENWKQIVSNYELGQTCGIHSPNLSYSRDSQKKKKLILFTWFSRKRGELHRNICVCASVCITICFSHTYIIMIVKQFHWKFD